MVRLRDVAPHPPPKILPRQDFSIATTPRTCPYHGGYHRRPAGGLGALQPSVSFSQRVRRRYDFGVARHVLMAEHIGLLIIDPDRGNPSTMIRRPAHFIFEDLTDQTKDYGLTVKHCCNRARGFSARARAIPFQLRSVCFRDKWGSIANWTSWTAKLNSRHRLSGCRVPESACTGGNIAANTYQFLRKQGNQ